MGPDGLKALRSASRKLDHADLRLLSELAREQVDRRKFERDIPQIRAGLSTFTRYAFRTLDPNTKLLWNWHIDAVADHLEACARREIKRLIVNIVPRYLKSMTATIAFPAWVLGNDPSERFMCASYSGDLAQEHGIATRFLMEQEWYQEVFPDTRVAGARDRMGKDTQSMFVTTQRGHRIAVGVGGTQTGRGGNILIVDDPVNPKQAASFKERKNANTWFDGTFYNRLNDKKNGVIIVIMQRLHELDLTGHLLEGELEGEGEWTHLKIPGYFERPAVFDFFRPRQIGGEGEAVTGVDIDAGTYLHEAREGEAEHKKMKKRLGTYGYAGQYIQEPSPDEGGLFKRYYFRFWQPAGANLPPVPVKKADGTIHLCEVVTLPGGFTRVIQSWDLPFTKGDLTAEDDGHSYAVGGVLARAGAERYLLDLHREQEEFPDTIKALRKLTAKWPQAKAKIVEKKANGPALIATLRKIVSGIIGYEPRGDKYTRAFAHQPLFEAGNVIIPHPRLFPWVDDYIDELATFPNAKNDDCVDMTSQGLDYLDKIPEQKGANPDWL
ncbi:MAG: phage terminase large subunit [Deltaproteobacteria bacterium]|nr:phage terminase large subunit [Deltaproteobacteria bacterium]